MEDTAHRAIAIVGIGAILPDAPNAAAFWDNVTGGRYSISEVTPDRWDPALYFDRDPKAPDKTYSKIGGWVREAPWDPIGWRLPIPPRVADAMDPVQQWAVAAAYEALSDYGYPARPLDNDRTAVILGNAMAGERHYLTSCRVMMPEIARELERTSMFGDLPEATRRMLVDEWRARIADYYPEITEDTMPGELANCMAGRIANLFNFHGPNYVTDAACASAMAAMSAAIEGLVERDFDVVVTGGIDRNMGISTFVKFCKIGALSATGTRPYADGADGFVMGEGAALFVLKRLDDAVRNQDKIYAVIRGVGGSSDGRGKGITAPNPIGQKYCIERAWRNAGISPATASLMEGHGTSTKVGDVVEVESLSAVLGAAGAHHNEIPLGSVKSNIGHLKGAAGAAGILKVALALHNRRLPPSLNCSTENPNIDFAHSPFFVNTELRDWAEPACGVRRAGVSAFGFGGTNFHVVLEEYVPGRLATGDGRTSVSVPAPRSNEPAPAPKTPPRGALLVGAPDEATLVEKLRAVETEAAAGRAPVPSAPAEADLRAPERMAIDYADASDLAAKTAKALKALSSGNAGVWKALRAQGIFRGRGPAAKVAFLYTGQGSQYVNMLSSLRASEPVVRRVFDEADRVTTPLLGKPLGEFIFVDGEDEQAVAAAEEGLRQTAITQPAVLAVDAAMTELLAAYGIQPDMVMGHSLGEYGALVAAGALPFEDALVAVSARGREMSRVSVDDCGWMVAVFAPLDEIERILQTVDGYVVIANINSNSQAVIGGASEAVERAMKAFQAAGYSAVRLPVSHAFHTSIVAPASEPLRRELARLRVTSPEIPIVANVSGEFYPMGENVTEEMLDILARQVASPVQFVTGLRTLYDAGARVFVEVGPKKALQGFVDDVLGSLDVVSLFTNHPKLGDAASFNQALCGLYAAGLGTGVPEMREERESASVRSAPVVSEERTGRPRSQEPIPAPVRRGDDSMYSDLGHLFADFLERGMEIYSGRQRRGTEARPNVVISGAGLGLPGTERIFDDLNVSRILHGQQFIDVIPSRFRRLMLDKHITRLVKSEDGNASFESIKDAGEVIKLAARGNAFDLGEEFGIAPERIPALDRNTKLAIAAGLEALRDAGIPLVMRYKTTTTGKQLPAGWGLPEEMRDDTGIIFASAFPGLDSFAEYLNGYHEDRARRERLADLESLRERTTDGATAAELDRRIAELRDEIDRHPFTFDRKFLFRILSMGHSQFAELVGARGPNTQVNSACASTTQAVGLAEDWIRSGRCRRVVVVSADDVTSDQMMEWVGAGFLATGAAATDDVVEEAATPFDRRRHGMILGMGAAAIVVEREEATAERGIRPICELLGAVTANSAFHGTRLDVDHISTVMERLVSEAEARWGIHRDQIAPEMVFVSHETYTPARGGSAAAEVRALRDVFGAQADRIVVANTKGFTGHPMGVGIEDVVAIKALETGIVPPVANFKEVDPDLGRLNLSKGGAYPVRYALRLGAGFGSQISMSLIRWVPSPTGAHARPESLGYAYRVEDPARWTTWLSAVSGYDAAEVEVANRTLRVKDQGAPARRPAAAPAVAMPVRAAAPAPPPPPPVEAPAPAAAAAPPAPPPAPVFEAAPIAAAPAVDAVRERVLDLVVEKTGYPRDMLDLDLDLEADLGVDTVKQAELFAAIRGAYDIPRDENLKLRDFPTIAHAIQFVYDRRPDLKTAAPVTAEPVAAPEPVPVAAASATASDPVRDKVLDLVVEKTGYPRDMLDLDLDLEADLGVDTVKQAELFAAIRGAYDIPRDENLKLRDFPTIAHAIQFVYDRRPDLKTAAPQQTTEPAPAEQPAPEGADTVAESVLALVAEKTGYPADMLGLDLDLEADLGIDTVKQAEIFAAARALYGIPRDENLKLRDFPTLAHVIQFVKDRMPKDAAPIEAAPQAVATAPTAAAIEGADQVPRRVPVPVLRPSLELCKPTGVEIGAGSRVVVMADAGGAGAALAATLRDAGAEVLTVDDAPDADGLASRLAEFAAAGPLTGVYWLPALDDEGPLTEMDLTSWREHLRVRVKLLYTAMRTLYDAVAAPGTFLVSATRLGGRHGYDEAGATAPLGGAVTGFTKAYKREQPEATVKAVDFELGLDPATLAERLLAETLRDPGAVEIGYAGGNRWSVSLEERPAADGQPGMALDSDSVLLITGAAGSIVSAITADLAAASGATFHLFDLVPEPDRNDSDVERFTTDRDGLKRDIFERLKASGERATPALVEKELAGIERASAALTAIRAVEAAGGTAYYYSVDLRDAEAVARAVDRVRERSGRVDVLLHAAGLEVSRRLRDKEPREFDLVFDVKSDGWFNLLHAAADMPIGATVSFSSIAGRFGNSGQTDYSSANDLLCKTTSSFRTTRPATRGIAIDWTAWGEIGMAARGLIPQIMERAGIDMLPPSAGIPTIRRELTAGGTRGELVVAGRLGIMLEEFDPTGGLEPDAVATAGPMTGRVTAMRLYGGLTVETELDPKAQPFLDDHRIDGTPVLPGVMGMEGFAELATIVFPGWSVAAVEDVRFLSPVKFYRDEPRTIALSAQFAAEGDEIVGRCELTASRSLPGQAEPQVTTHFTGRVRLSREPFAETVEVPNGPTGAVVTAEEIYRIYFHGPAYKVLESAWLDDGNVVGLMAADLPPNHTPEEQRLLLEPRLVELCFQTAGVLEIGTTGRMGLPNHVASVAASNAAPEGRIRAVVTPDWDRGAFDAVAVDESGTVLVRLTGYATVELPGELDAERVEPLRRATLKSSTA